MSKLRPESTVRGAVCAQRWPFLGLGRAERETNLNRSVRREEPAGRGVSMDMTAFSPSKCLQGCHSDNRECSLAEEGSAALPSTMQSPARGVDNVGDLDLVILRGGCELGLAQAWIMSR
jgi:hypothetical protein